MKTLIVAILRTLVGILKSRAALHLEILALGQQLAMVTHSAPKRYRFQRCQHIFRVGLFRFWPPVVFMIISPSFPKLNRGGIFLLVHFIPTEPCFFIDARLNEKHKIIPDKNFGSHSWPT